MGDDDNVQIGLQMPPRPNQSHDNSANPTIILEEEEDEEDIEEDYFFGVAAEDAS